MTIEPPRGVKANIMRAYANQVAENLEFFNSDHEKVAIFKLISIFVFVSKNIEKLNFIFIEFYLLILKILLIIKIIVYISRLLLSNP